jgi:hypothetical protein
MCHVDKFNQMLLRFGIAHPNFKSFMVDNVQAIRMLIVYGFGDPSIKMVGKERTYFFHWIHSFGRHMKQLITSNNGTRHCVTFTKHHLF